MVMGELILRAMVEYMQRNTVSVAGASGQMGERDDWLAEGIRTLSTDP